MTRLSTTTGAVLAALTTASIASAAPAAAPRERRLHTDNVDASTFLWNDWNKFVENYHPNYVADDDPTTAWVEGSKGSGAGEWLRVQLTPLDATTRVRLRVRNGYQKSKELFGANARAKEVTVRLLPGNLEKKLVLADKDGWQELTIEQPSGELRAVELKIASVHEGSKYADLCISDIQVFATSTTPDNPAFEKSRREKLMTWRDARLAAAKQFASNKTGMPLYPAYAITATKSGVEMSGISLAEMVATAAKDATFAKEWKDALAIATAATTNLGALTRVQIAPRSRTKLVAVDGAQITEVGDIATGEGPYLEEDAFRLPMLGTVAALFADQLRVLDIKDKQTILQFEEAKPLCKTDVLWALRKPSKEATGPSTLQAVVVGRCARVEGREGHWNARILEMLVYDASGRLALVVGDGHVEGYRWGVENGKPMLVGARSLLALPELVIEAKKRDALAAK
ncbi:MAG: hypothetical protein H0T89_21140 [Deltaproteobacteria bacterium]|nr:hypothetical protein [Deltaproteobacteria bacterium]MDQ3298318.1 hypothetical protein [Myxococcota bacterium]